ncbi:MAG: LPS export ABC transporter permease LptG [Gammaproteobacteria bacterium]|nr:LPS export ABC transporter permease LptG [Gammaproteobacteria bacterium]
MKLLDRYIGRNVVLSILLSLVILLTLVAFVSLLEEMEDVGRGNYRTWDAIQYVLLILPRVAYEIFPVAVLLGSLVGMGGFATHSELIAMRAAGISLNRLVISALKAGLVFVVAVILIGEFVAPVSEQWGEQMRAAKLSKQITLKTKYGFWARDRNAIINIRYIISSSHLKDIYIYEFDNQQELKVATYAENANYQKANEWLLRGIKQSLFSEGQVESRQLESAAWASMLNPELLDIVVRPSLLPIWGLHQYIRFMQDNGLEAIGYEVAFWSKIVTPVTTLIMVFLSVPVVFGVLRSVGIGQRIFVGGLLGTAFLMLNKAFANMAVVFHLNPFFAAVFPTALVLGLGIWFMRKHH